jgi:hypothetical protein
VLRGRKNVGWSPDAKRAGWVYVDRMAARMISLLAVLLLAAVTLPAGGAAAKAKKAPCSARESQTLVATPTARLYDVVSDDGYEVFGCLKRLGRRVSLFRGDDPGGDSCLHTCERLVMPRLGGNYAAYVYRYDFSYGGGAPDEHTRSVRVVDLRTGRKVREYPGGPSVLLLSGGGTTIALTSVVGGYELVAHWTFGVDRTLDSGAIAPASVVLDGSTVRWSKAGVPAVASLR